MLGRLNLPLRPATPPRSPHNEPVRGAFPFLSVDTSSYPSSSDLSPSSSTRGAAQAAVDAPFYPGPTNTHAPHSRRARSMKPTRRDITIFGITIFLSWLLFGAQDIKRGGLAGFGGGGGSRRTGSGDGLGDLEGEEWDTLAGDEYPSRPAAGAGGYIGKLGEFMPKFGLGWLGNSAPSQGHSEGNIGMEMVCEVGAGGQVRIHGYSDSVAKHPIFPEKIDSASEEDADIIYENDSPGMTRLVGHQPGWTIFENLYLSEGTLWIVTDEPAVYPEMRMMTSTGLPANNEPGNEEAREPKGDELRIITPKEAKDMWGDRVWEMEGVTWLFNDGQFVDHYYHYAAELLLGVWRTYASLGKDFTPDGRTTLPAPARSWFIRLTSDTWRDKPSFNPTILWSAFPSMSVLYSNDWADIKRATGSNSGGTKKAYLFPRAILADRSAAFRGPWTGPTSRTVASAMKIGEPGPWWWEPIRRQVLRFAGADESTLDVVLEGYGAIDPARLEAEPDLKDSLQIPSREIGETLAGEGRKPLVTYISRQGSRRRLTEESHKELEKALEKHSKEKGWELLVVEAEKLTKEEQLLLAAKTTIMLGVHGNGLTHLLWMPPTQRSAVIEMFVKDGFARDYQWTAHALGIRHFAVRHDTYATSPHEPKVDYPEGFQGTGITVVGEVVAKLIDDRLEGKV